MRLLVLAMVITLTVTMVPWSVADAATTQKWFFNTDANPASPEVVDNIYGTPSAVINVDPIFGTGWYDAEPIIFGSAQGFWDLGTGSIVLNVPCSTSLNDIQISVKYWMDLSQAPVLQLLPSYSFISKTTSLIEADPMMGGWYEDVWNIKALAETGEYTFTFLADQGFGSIVDEIGVTTTSAVVPEPASLAALSMGILGLAFRRRKA